MPNAKELENHFNNLQEMCEFAWIAYEEPAYLIAAHEFQAAFGEALHLARHNGRTPEARSVVIEALERGYALACDLGYSAQAFRSQRLASELRENP